MQGRREGAAGAWISFYFKLSSGFGVEVKPFDQPECSSTIP